MMEDDLRQRVEPSLAQTGFVWFMRLLSIYCLTLGVAYWIRLIGLHQGLLWRFDLMPWQWQTAAVSLAVLFPVAATGLWMRAPWGPVIWFAAALIETLMYTVFERIFAANPMVAVTNLLILLLYIAFRIVLFWQGRTAAQKLSSFGQR
ncbi:DUF6163 family protein [Phyllobacterium phragmitis]|uniref:DUF6163 family protein n=1 Tax=Phyllobacterium phragmitis TaxID=2670329 RepID=A0ABQ0GYE8_9HYPH